MSDKSLKTILYIVVPCYNECEVLGDCANTLLNKLDRLIAADRISEKSRILFVDDGSTDTTWEMIRDLHTQNNYFCGLSFAKNRGHQNALMAGLMFARDKADATITIDADLQQDVEAMDRFLDEFDKGSEIVFGIRNTRDTDGFMKKASANAYYSIMNHMGANIHKNAADYRLLSKTALDALVEYKEVNLFLRGIVSDIGLKSSVVYFDVFPRTKGTSKYSLKKMIRLAINGISSFTHMPLHIMSVVGSICVLISIAMTIYAFVDWLCHNTVPGYSTILISIWFLGGMILFGIGIVGEYVAQTYLEAKHRPRYFIKDRCVDAEEKE